MGVDTSGRPVIRLLAYAFVLVILAGCHPAADRPAARDLTASPSPAGSTAGPPSPTSHTPCRVKAPVALRDSLRTQWSHPLSQAVDPFSSGVSGQTVAQVRSARFSGVALVRVPDGHIQSQIDRFANPRLEQAGGAFDGMFAVWKDYRTPNDLGDFTVKLWSKGSGTVTTVGSAHRDAHGQVFPSPWQDPVVAGGYAAWVEGLDQQGRGQIVLLDLRSHHRYVVSTGHPGWLALTSGLLVWAESPKPGAETVVHAVDPSTRRVAPVPPALASATGAWGFVSDGRGWAWVGDDSKAIYYAADPAQPPVRVTQVSIGGYSPPLAMVPGALVVPLSAGGLVLVNTGSQAYSVMPDAALAREAGSSLLVQPENASKEATVRPIAQVEASALSELHC